MSRRPVRLFVLLLAVVVTAAAVWRLTTNEQIRAAARRAAQDTDSTAAAVIAGLSDLRATLHAYVAPGQGDPFWSTRATSTLAAIRRGLMELDAPAASAGLSLDATIDALSRLETMELRVREYVRADQPRLAGDIIFSDGRDLIDTSITGISDARQVIGRVASSRVGAITNEQYLMAGALLATWILAAIVLLPLPAAPMARAGASTASRLADGPDLSLRSPATSPAERRVARTPPASDRPAGPKPPPWQAALAQTPPVAATNGPERTITPAAISSLAAICSDLGRATEVADLEPLLARGAKVVGATGLVVWMTTPDGERLSPGVSHGYDDRALARMGEIALSSDNLTVSAYTTRVAALRAPDAGVPGIPGAVAVPLLTSNGVAGVLSAEVSADRDLETVAALTAVLAAQLAMLFSPPAATTEAESQKHAQA